MTGPDVLAQIPAFLRTHGLIPEFFEFLKKLARRHPDYAGQIALIGSFFIEPARGYRLLQGIERLDAKIAAAGFSDHPADYLWRPAIEGVIAFRDLKDGTADLDDIVAANDALDRHLVRQRVEVETPKQPTREAKARKIAKVMLQSGLAKAERGGLSQAAREIAPTVEMTLSATRNAIRDMFRT